MNHGGVESHYDWLVMLFLGGGNDLFKFGEDLLVETQRVGSTDRVAVVAEHDPTEPGEPTVRGQILNGQWEKESIGLTAGDPQTILDFIKYSKRRFPARHIGPSEVRARYSIRPVRPVVSASSGFRRVRRTARLRSYSGRAAGWRA